MLGPTQEHSGWNVCSIGGKSGVIPQVTPDTLKQVVVLFSVCSRGMVF